MKKVDNHTLRKIIHSYALIFRKHFLDEMVQHPNYSLLYTLDDESAFFNSAININLTLSNLEEELDYIERYFKLRRKKPCICIEESTRPVDLEIVLKRRGYEYVPKENCVMWVKALKDKSISTNKEVEFKIVEDYETFQDYLFIASKGWKDQFDYSKYASSLSKQYSKSFDGVTTFHILGYMNSKPICSSTLGFYFDMAHLINISVFEKYRRKGIASAMINYASELSQKNDIKNIYIDIDEKDIPGTKLLEKNGFTKIIQQKMYIKYETK